MPPTPDTSSPTPSNSRKRHADMSIPRPAKIRAPRSTIIHPSGQTTKLQLGSAVSFVVHTERLKLSPYFNALLNNNTGATVSLTLSDIDPHDFRIYNNFLYTGYLATDTTGSTNNPIALRTEFALLGKLYRFGHTVQDPQFRNATLDGIIEISRLKNKDTGVPYLPDTNILGENLPRDSPGRRCIVDIYVHFLDPEDPAIDQMENQEFMRDFLRACMRKVDMKNEHGSFRRQDLRKCDYHEHEDGMRCDLEEEK